MMDPTPFPLNESLEEDIRRTFARAIESGGVVRIAEEARRLAVMHPDAGLTSTSLARALLEIGIGARVALEIDTGLGAAYPGGRSGAPPLDEVIERSLPRSTRRLH